MARDDDRPRYHFVPPPSWINDPKPFFWDGAYHVYFQYCPGTVRQGRKHWGHAVSRDLVGWEELPIALSPTAGGPDADGCWTGSVVHDDDTGEFHILYTGIPSLTRPAFDQVQCLATSTDLVEWRKYPGNPVIAASQQPEGYGTTFRDPCVWREGHEWLCVIGGNRPENGDPYRSGAAFLYRSPDLVTWEYLHPLYVGPAAGDECPDFFPLDGPSGRRWVLISSRQDVRGIRGSHTAWAVGDYVDHRFVPEQHGSVDDHLYYAAKTLVDDRGRRILFGWVREDRFPEAADWSGTIALPRVLTLLPDGTLGAEPAPELESLRRTPERHGPETLEPGRTSVSVPAPAGGCMEIQAVFAPHDAETFGVVLPDGTEVGYDRGSQTLAGRPLALGRRERLAIRIFVDHSVVEVFAHQRVCKTIRAYGWVGRVPSTLGLFATGGRVGVESVDIWPLGDD